MTMMSDFKRSRWRNVLLAATMVLATAGAAFPQATSSASGNAAKPISDEGEYSTWDIGGFFGTQWFQLYQGTANPNNVNPKLLTRPVFGIRSTQDFTRYFGIEESVGVGWNRLALLPYGGGSYAEVPQRDWQFSVLGLAYLKPRTARIRPYFEFGPTGVVYMVGRLDSLQLPNNPIPTIYPAALRTKIEPGFSYGMGVKMDVSHNIDVKIDVQGLYTPTPDFGLAGTPSAPGQLYVPTNRGENGLQFTAGVYWRKGFHEPPPPPAPAPPPPPPPPAPKANVQVGAIQGAHDVCPGDNIRLQANASGWLPDQTPTYQWFINNQPAPGGNGPTFNMPTADGSGEKAVKVTVSAGDSMATSPTVNVLVRMLTPPTIQFPVSPSTINYGDKLPLNATAMGSQCGGPATVRYSASEGTIAGNTFDSTGVSFDMSNRLKQQSKTVTLTATATDTKQQMASATANVTVDLKPEASRVDIVFANRSARVNNAAKRYLIEQLTPRLRDDPNSSVILIGHRDTSETGRAAAALDTQRVLNTAAVLSAGKGVCPSLDLSRVQVEYAGSDQTNPPMPFADSSVKERTGQGATDQRAQFRRVEVWFVPGGADKPALSGLMPAPEKEIKAKGCPR